MSAAARARRNADEKSRIISPLFTAETRIAVSAHEETPNMITAIPMVFMFGVSSWALTAILISAVKSGEMIRLFSSAFLLALAAALIVIAALKGRKASQAE